MVSYVGEMPNSDLFCHNFLIFCFRRHAGCDNLCSKTCQFKQSTKYEKWGKSALDYKHRLSPGLVISGSNTDLQLFPWAFFYSGDLVQDQLPGNSPGRAHRRSESHPGWGESHGAGGSLRSTEWIPALLSNSYWPSSTILTPNLWAAPETDWCGSQAVCS